MHPVVQTIINQLKPYRPEKIILFGSYASGNPTEDSDVDLLVVQDSQKAFLERITEIRSHIKTRTPLDLIVLTPQEAKELSAKSTFFSQIFNEGKLLYGGI